MASSSSSTMDESSIETPETNMSFQIKPATLTKLKLSLSSLSDSDFNPLGVAMLNVSKLGFAISVRNTLSNTAGKFFLYSYKLIDFHCIKPIEEKMIPINQVCEILNSASHGDSITVFHLHDSATYLSFSIGSAPAREFSVELMEKDEEYQNYPDEIEHSCEIVLQSKTLRELVKRLDDEDKGIPLVSLNIKEEEVSIYVELKNAPWTYEITYEDENFDVRILTQEREYHAWFELRHLGSMKRASIVAQRFHILLLTKPPKNNVMIQFNIDELGELVFILKGVLVIKNPDRIALNTEDDAPRASQFLLKTSDVLI